MLSAFLLEKIGMSTRIYQKKHKLQMVLLPYE